MDRFGTVFGFFGSPQRHREHEGKEQGAGSRKQEAGSRKQRSRSSEILKFLNSSIPKFLNS
jgi:hypothetical protein